MKNLNVYSFSKSDVTRHIVIDHSVIIEELVTETIGRLLEIDCNTSKALGPVSGGLSFHQKTLLITDKFGEIGNKSKKIIAFYQIRNKFAHLTISTWTDFFSISDTYKKIEKDLNIWYDKEENNETSYENKVRLLYFYLTREIFYFLIEINKDWAVNKGRKIAENDIKQKLFELTIENPSEDIRKVWNQIKEELS